MPTITLKLKNKSLGEYPLQMRVSLTIGRREANDLVIADRSVSGHHAKIDSVEDRFVLTDLQSKNGTFVNDQLIHSHWLKHGDVITIGGRPRPKVNDEPIKKSTVLYDQDIIEIGGVRLQFSVENP